MQPHLSDPLYYKNKEKRNHKEKCEKIGNFPQDLPPPPPDLENLQNRMIFRKNEKIR